jgi:hypothetical protein
MELGRGLKGLIGHTQNTVGHQLDHGVVADVIAKADLIADTAARLRLQLILLAEIQQDRLLMQYDTIIIDEAHERSLNIDFL